MSPTLPFVPVEERTKLFERRLRLEVVAVHYGPQTNCLAVFIFDYSDVFRGRRFCGRYAYQSVAAGGVCFNMRPTTSSSPWHGIIMVFFLSGAGRFQPR